MTTFQNKQRWSVLWAFALWLVCGSTALAQPLPTEGARTRFSTCRELHIYLLSPVGRVDRVPLSGEQRARFMTHLQAQRSDANTHRHCAEDLVRFEVQTGAYEAAAGALTELGRATPSSEHYACLDAAQEVGIVAMAGVHADEPINCSRAWGALHRLDGVCVDEADRRVVGPVLLDAMQGCIDEERTGAGTVHPLSGLLAAFQVAGDVVTLYAQNSVNLPMGVTDAALVVELRNALALHGAWWSARHPDAHRLIARAAAYTRRMTSRRPAGSLVYARVEIMVMGALLAMHPIERLRDSRGWCETRLQQALSDRAMLFPRGSDQPHPDAVSGVDMFLPDAPADALSLSRGASYIQGRCANILRP